MGRGDENRIFLVVQYFHFRQIIGILYFKMSINSYTCARPENVTTSSETYTHIVYVHHLRWSDVNI